MHKRSDLCSIKHEFIFKCNYSTRVTTSCVCGEFLKMHTNLMEIYSCSSLSKDYAETLCLKSSSILLNTVNLSEIRIVQLNMTFPTPDNST